MATFYVLPPRACLEEQLATMLKSLLPGLPVPVDSWDVVAECFAAAGRWPADVYLVTRDEIPFGESTSDALEAYFGAEAGDRVIEVSASGSKTWTLTGMSAPLIAR